MMRELVDLWREEAARLLVGQPEEITPNKLLALAYLTCALQVERRLAAEGTPRK
jgi:hypothetical protein